ncbi:Putative serine/threonine-protein kinase pknH [Minicystis rosea]|nr:Putative serine/threonine-protein kinase pknH [Minicystis rosea]
MTSNRRSALAVVVGASILGGCQLLSGLNELHEGSGGASSSSSVGGGMSASVSASSVSASSTGGGSSVSSSSSSSSGGCADLGTSQNCGACGHDCINGSCSDSLCTDYVLVDTTVASLSGLASDGSYVYWGRYDSTVAGSIGRASIHGTDPELTYITSVQPHGLVTNGTSLFFWDGTGTKGIRVATPNPPEPIAAQPLFAEPQEIGSLALAGGKLTWNTPIDSGLKSGNIMGGTPASAVVPMSSVSFAVDENYVYWAADSAIWRRTTSLTDAPKQIGVASGVVSMVADPVPGGYVYWAATSPTPGIYRAKKDGSVMMSDALFAAASHPYGLLADAENVYWTEYASSLCNGLGTLQSQSGVGGLPHAVTVVGACSLLAQDAKGLYFTTGTQIRRVTKPLLTPP